MISYPSQTAYMAAKTSESMDPPEISEVIPADDNSWSRRSRDRSPVRRSRDHRRSSERRRSKERRRSREKRRSRERQSSRGSVAAATSVKSSSRTFVETAESEESMMMKMAGIPTGFGGKPKKNRAAAFVVEKNHPLNFAQQNPVNPGYSNSTGLPPPPAPGASLFPISF